jgi:hypothetical protein
VAKTACDLAGDKLPDSVADIHPNIRKKRAKVTGKSSTDPNQRFRGDVKVCGEGDAQIRPPWSKLSEQPAVIKAGA